MLARMVAVSIVLGACQASSPSPSSTFNLVSAAAVDGFTFTATFDAAPEPTQAIDKRNWLIGSGAEDIYSLSSVTLTLHGNTVTFSNAPQDVNRSYSVWVQDVHRASDGETVAPPGPIYFRGISAYFRPRAASSKGVFAVDVTFDDVPETISATTLANYTLPGLTLSGTPTLAGRVVTLTTSAQSNATYKVTVANVTRASNGQALCEGISPCVPSATFLGTSHCTDLALDGDETDINCGGSSCPKCASGKACLVGTDCVSGTCNGGPPGTCM